MKKVLLNDQQIAAYKQMNLSASTVYYRLSKGWDPDKAVTTPSKTRNTKRSDRGVYGVGEKKGKYRTFSLPERLERRFDLAIKKSGMNQADLVAKIIEQWLQSKNRD